jgi:plastocyanin
MVRMREFVEEGLPLMRRGFTALIACSALVLLAGCGSSSSSGAKSSTSSSAGAGSKRKTTATKSTPSVGIKVDGAPKYASPSSSEPVQSGVVNVAYRNIAIDPDTVRVKAGSTIRWTNYDSEPCNVTSEGGAQKFASKDFGEGATFELKATAPGIIHYECTGYPATMNGTIEVVK